MQIAKLTSLELDFRFDLLHNDSKQYVHVYSGEIRYIPTAIPP